MRLPSILLAAFILPVDLALAQAQASHFPMIPIPGARSMAAVAAADRIAAFSTWQQCMATVSGIGGFCEPNQFYNPRGGSKSRKKQPR